MAVSLFPFNVLVLLREVRLLEQFCPARAVHAGNSAGDRGPDHDKILSGEGVFILLAKIPLAVGCYCQYLVSEPRLITTAASSAMKVQPLKLRNADCVMQQTLSVKL
ncbi:MAG TPA: hypothetical protein VL087_04200 [Nitrospirota bacterium]|nr:hypothetical protein [Nitrospirota bacterium]